jgi:hypothetical protein
LALRLNNLHDEVLKLKNSMENQVDVSKTATGCNNPSASQRFVHQETPMNQNKGLPHNKGEMDIESGGTVTKQYQF